MGRMKELLMKQYDKEFEEALCIGYEEHIWNDQEPAATDLDLMEQEANASYRTNDIIPKRENDMKTKMITTGNEVLEINSETGEILVTGSIDEFTQIRTTKIKALRLLKQEDFAYINGIWEPKRDGLIKILSSLPISYRWVIVEQELTDNRAYVKGKLSIQSGSTMRSSEAMGICELVELRGNGGMHFMNARAETRAMKRAIETLFGSIINYYVVNYLAYNPRFENVS